MSEEMKETTKPTEITEFTDWEVEDFVDSAQAAGVIDALVYSFKQGGREVTGLTARAIEELCLCNDPKVSIVASNVERTEDEVIATATAGMTYHHPKKTTTQPDGTVIETEGYEEVVTADGIRAEPTVVSGRKDPYVEMKALTKAMRAARRQLISQEKQIQAKQNLLALQGGKPVNVGQQKFPQNVQQQPPQTQKTEERVYTPTETALRRAFAIFSERQDEILKLGVKDFDTFWLAVKKVADVESRNDMTKGQWDELAEALKEDKFGLVVRKVLEECKVDVSQLD